MRGSLRLETKTAKIIRDEYVASLMRHNGGDASLIYYQSNIIDGDREPSEDEILKIDVVNEVKFDVGGVYTILQ